MRKLLEIIGGFLKGFLFLLLIEVFSRSSLSEALQWSLSHPLMLCMNLLFFAGIALMLYAIVRIGTRWLVFSLLGLVFSLLGLINRYKMRFRYEPLLLTDALQIGDAMTTVTHLDFNINVSEILLLIGAALFAGIIGYILLRKRKKRSNRIAVILGLCLTVGIPFACTFSLADSVNRFDLMDQCSQQGVAYTLFAVENHRRAQTASTDTEQDIRAAYCAAKQKVSPLSEESRPNIIFILYESFADEKWLSQYLTLTEPVTPVFSGLSETCRTGSIFVPKIGGGTSETEFEVLTGISSTWGFNPYCLALPKLNSVASILHDKGYATSCIHWYQGGYYNRYKNMRMLGFDTYYTTDTTEVEPHPIGMFNSDADHYAAALQKMNMTSQQDFLFLITIQNHGGYTYADLGFPKSYEGAYSEPTDLVLRNYLGLLKESNIALSQFLSELEAREEETWVICFSDHIPPFGKDVFDELGINPVSQSNHLTPYFIWCSNAEKNCSVQENCYAFELAPYALQTIGLLDDPFFSLVNQIRLTDSGKDIPLTENRHDNAEYTMLSRDMLFGKQFSYQEGAISVPDDLKIGGDMTLSGLTVTEAGENALMITPETADWPNKATLFVNGHEHGGRVISKQQNGPVDIQFKQMYAGKVLNESNILHFDSIQELMERRLKK